MIEKRITVTVERKFLLILQVVNPSFELGFSCYFCACLFAAFRSEFKNVTTQADATDYPFHLRKTSEVKLESTNCEVANNNLAVPSDKTIFVTPPST